MADRLTSRRQVLHACAGTVALGPGLLAAATRSANPMETFEWLATECAPEDYPARIVRGHLRFADGRTLYIPDDQLVRNGWGERGSIHIVGDKLKPVPTHLELRWFSYLEDRFYGGRFELPTARMLAMFRARATSPEPGPRLPFNRIVVGVAPGGDIAVWMGAGRLVTEVAIFRAPVIDLPWTTVLDNPDIARARYIADALKEALPADVLQRVTTTPVPAGRWSTVYARRLPWAPRLRGAQPATDLWLRGYNGEHEWIDLSGTRTDTDPPPATRGVPRELTLFWRHSSGTSMRSVVTMDEREAFAAFAKLTAADPAAPLMLLLEPSSDASRVEILLQQRELAYRFERAVTKSYRVG